jgi:hypothetical protein
MRSATGLRMDWLLLVPVTDRPPGYILGG